MTIGLRIKSRRTEIGMTQERLAITVGVSQGLIGQLESNRNEDSKHLRKIAAALGVRVEWLESGDGSVAESNDRGRPVQAWAEIAPDGMILISEHKVSFAAGNGRTASYDEIHEATPRAYSLDWFRKEGIRRADKCRRFKVAGDSMSPMLFDGDTVLVNLAEVEVQDGKVYALRYGDELRIKRLYKRLGGGLVLHSDNAAFGREELGADEVAQHISIIGRVRDKSGSGGL